MTRAIRMRAGAVSVGLLALCVAHGVAQTPGQTAEPTAPAAAPNAANAALPPDLATSVIQDPSLNNIAAGQVNYPKGWHMAGAMYLDGAIGAQTPGICAPGQAVAYRVTSPDGLRFAEQLPDVAWNWETGPKARSVWVVDCLPEKGPMTAAAFARHMADVLGIEYAGEEPVPARILARQDRQLKLLNTSLLKLNPDKRWLSAELTGETAWARVRFANGSFAMAGQLRVQIGCLATPDLVAQPEAMKFAQKTPVLTHSCTAAVSFMAAPEAAFAAWAEEWDRPLPFSDGTAVMATMTATASGKGTADAAGKGAQPTTASDPGAEPLGSDGMGARPLAAWMTARQAAARHELDRYDHPNNVEEFRILSWQSALHQSLAVRKRIAYDWRGAARSTTFSNFDDVQMIRQTRGDGPLPADWLDYLLGKFESPDGKSEDTQLMPLKAIQWVEAGGKDRFYTRDAEANPNGVLAGTWTKGTWQTPDPQ